MMEIETSARLHLSLIDLNGSEGRLDGGIGISLKEPTLRIKCEECNKTNIRYASKYSQSETNIIDSKIIETTNIIKKYLNIDTDYEFNIQEMYPAHLGLGLGTQLSLSIAKLITSMNDLSMTACQLADIVHRGGTSGIGVHSFDKGGIIIDGGHKTKIKNDFLPSSASHVAPPPLLARYNFPEKWSIILVIPDKHESVSGQKEVNIFQEYTPIKQSDVEKISYLTLMKLMPAVLEEDLNSFSEAVNTIQKLGFKNVERNLQTRNITKLLENMENMDIPCVGMSSFGPTCFGIIEKPTKGIINELKDMIKDKGKIMVTQGKNNGSKIY